MGNTTGFLDHLRVTGPYRPVRSRLKDYKEFINQLDHNMLKIQGSRCMDCGIPYCHAMGCPLENLIPEWNDSVYNDNWREALIRLESTNNLPEITGRICPAPCEASCTLSINDAPVTIKQIELAIIEYGFSQGWISASPPEVETGKKVAVVGSGPAGLAAAQQLRRFGHSVTVYEKSEKAGGILRYGIPDFKLEKWVIDRRLNQMYDEGIRFETNVNIGKDISARYLKKNFDAIVITMGAGEPRDLDIEGRKLKGVHFAMEYLTESNKLISGEIAASQQKINAKGKNVLVIGGGDTGSDCVGTANRQGASQVYQFEIMPKPPEWKESWNPDWPYWPVILRTSSSHEEGCKRDWSIQTSRFIGKNGKIEEVEFVKVKWERTKESGVLKPVEIPGSKFSLKIDLVFLATGFLHIEHNKFLEDLELKLDQRGNVMLDEYFSTSSPGVFVAGDSATGASLVVRAISHGRKAAEAINQQLKSL